MKSDMILFWALAVIAVWLLFIRKPQTSQCCGMVAG
jgi:hypothetical protein